MIIKCPQCSTGYSIPENMIGEKPRKMRCSRCKNTFTIVRRQETTLTGYEEFTGKQHLPDEFAFLRESPKADPEPQASPSPPQDVAAEPQALQVPQAPPFPAKGLYKAIVEGPTQEPEAIPLEPRVVSGPTRDPNAAPPEPPSAQVPQPPPPPAPAAPPAPAPAAPPAPPAPEPPRASAPSVVGDIYGGTASAWEMEAPLELGGFAITEETPPQSQSVGKFITIVIVLAGIFFLFVAYRNGWSLSIPDLGDQIAFAFSGDELETLPEEVENMDSTIANKKMLVGKNGTAFLVISGEVINDNLMGRANVIMRGRLIDAAGDVRSEVRSPCGKTVDDSVLEATEKGQVSGHYRQGGTIYNCQMSANESTVYQMIFEDVPADYDSSFTVEIQAVGATILN